MTGDFSTLHKHQIRPKHFQFQEGIYNFIHDYYFIHKDLPDISTIIENYPDYEVQETADTLSYLCNALKDSTAKKLGYELLQNEVSDKFNQLSGKEFIQWLRDEVEHIIDVTGLVNGTGSDYSMNEKDRLARYEHRKEQGASIFVPYPYSQLTQWLCGGSELGDYVLLMANSNVGKSWICSDIAVYQWKKGFGVLHYSPELTRTQCEDRLDTLRFKVHNSGIRAGNLKDEERYKRHLQDSMELQRKAPYLIKTMEDMPDGLTLELIEADIMSNPDIKVVVIDGFNLITHGGRDSNRNNMSSTSRRLRRLFSKFGVLGIVVHQAKGSAMENSVIEDKDGGKTIKPPELSDYSETIAVIQDATTVLTFNADDGVGVLYLAKSRTPYRNKKLYLSVDFDRGWINPTKTGSDFPC